MMKIFLKFILIMLFSYSLKAQVINFGGIDPKSDNSTSLFFEKILCKNDSIIGFNDNFCCISFNRGEKWELIDFKNQIVQENQKDFITRDTDIFIKDNNIIIYFFGKFFITKDFGRNFERISNKKSLNVNDSDIGLNLQATDGYVYKDFYFINTNDGLYRSKDCNTWEKLNIPEGIMITKFASYNNEIYFSTLKNIYKSNDFGDSWNKIEEIVFENSIETLRSNGGIVELKAFNNKLYIYERPTNSGYIYDLISKTKKNLGDYFASSHVQNDTLFLLRGTRYDKIGKEVEHIKLFSFKDSLESSNIDISGVKTSSFKINLNYIVFFGGNNASCSLNIHENLTLNSKENLALNLKENIDKNLYPENLDNLKLGDFKPFPKFLTKQPNAACSNDGCNVETYDWESWEGELFLKGGLIFNPRRSPNGFTVYDINRKQYGRVNYSINDRYSNYNPGLLVNNFDNGNSFYSYSSTRVYKTLLSIEDYSNFKYYQYPYYEKPSLKLYELTPTSVLEMPEPGTSFEIEVSNKIYTFEYYRDASGRNETFHFNISKSDNIVTCAKVKAAHNLLNYVYITTHKDGVNLNGRLLDINNIINNIYLEKKVNQGYGVVDTKEGFGWNIDNVNYLNDGKILLTINVLESFSRQLPTGLPIDFTKKTQMVVLLKSNLNFIKANKIAESDITLFSSSSNDFYKIIKNGAKVICYNENLDFKWYKEFAVENKKDEGVVSFWKEINNKIYLMGTASNKYHIGKSDPIIYKIDAKSGELISEEVIKLKTATNYCTGFIIDKKVLYLVVVPEKSDSYDKSNRDILMKVNLTID